MNKNKKYDKQIADELNACFESILAGGDSVESCLASYPQHAAELGPLLETMKAARAASSLSPDPSFRARARYEFRSALYERTSPKKSLALTWRWRWATIVSIAGMFALTSAGGVVAASSGSMPGQTLYQVKRTIENVQITITPTQSARARLYATLADRRIGEIVYAASNLKDPQGVIADLTQQFTQDLSNVSSIVTPARALTFGASPVNGSSPEKGAQTTTTVTAGNDAANPPGFSPAASTPPMTTTAVTAPSISGPPAVTIQTAPTPTIVVSVPPVVTVTQNAPVPTPTFTVNVPNITIAQPGAVNLSGITDPLLLKLLQQYSVKNLAELMSILDKVSPEVKAAVIAAIEAASSGYGQLLGS
jgi:hypothetical protein